MKRKDFSRSTKMNEISQLKSSATNCMAASKILLDQIRYNIKNRITLISFHNSMFPKYQISLTKTGLLSCSLLSLGRINHATAWTEIRLKIASTK